MTVSLPYNADAEKSVLGSLLIDPSAIDEVPSLRVEHFYLESHRVIYAAMQHILEEGLALDLVTLTDHLRRRGQLDDVGSVPYLVGLADSQTTAAYIDSYVRILAHARLRREIITLGQFAQSQAADLSHAPEEVLNAIEGRIGKIRGRRSEVPDYAEQAAEFATQSGSLFLPIGLSDFDALTGGIRGLVIVGARPSMGKSALLRGILKHTVERGLRAALFTQDQSGMDVYALEASLRSRVSFQSIKTRTANEYDTQAWLGALAALRTEYQRKFVVDDYPYNLDELVPRIRSAVYKDGASIVGVDYLQLIDVPGAKAEHTTQATGRVSKALKHLSQELGVPIVALAQLNRGVESRPDRRPRLDDLRETGQIEQDAEMVVFLYREEYYNARAEGRAEHKLSHTDVMVAKNKTGPTGGVTVRFNNEFLTFHGRHDATFGIRKP